MFKKAKKFITWIILASMLITNSLPQAALADEIVKGSSYTVEDSRTDEKQASKEEESVVFEVQGKEDEKEKEDPSAGGATDGQESEKPVEPETNTSEPVTNDEGQDSVESSEVSTQNEDSEETTPATGESSVVVEESSESSVVSETPAETESDPVTTEEPSTTTPAESSTEGTTDQQGNAGDEDAKPEETPVVTEESKPEETNQSTAPATNPAQTEEPVVEEEQKQEEVKTEETKVEESKVEESKVEESKVEEPQSDPTADVETAEDWNASVWNHLSESLTGEWGKDLVIVAKTQLNYAESTKNFTKDANGIVRGWNRYAAWAGVSPYEDWCTLFILFCEDYAGFRNDLPEAASFGVEGWVEILKAAQRYEEAGKYIPKPGDYIFFVDEDAYKLDPTTTKAGHVGIVSEVKASEEDESVVYLSVIEGNSANMVQQTTYLLTNPKIVGYGVLPENPALKQEEAPVEEKAEEIVPVEEEPKVTIATDTITVIMAPFSERPLMAEGSGDGSQTTYTVDEIHDLIAAEAERLYRDATEENPKGTHNPQVNVEVTPSENNLLLAGAEIEYTIKYTFFAPDTWDLGYDATSDLYDTYFNNKIQLHLPAGLLLVLSGSGFTADPNDSNNTDLSKEHTYTLNFESQGAQFNSESLKVKIYIGNNGTENSVTTYSFPNDMVKFSTSFTVVDKQKKWTGSREIKTYNHSTTGSADPITTTSPDNWIVKKAIYSEQDVTGLSTDKKTVTFAWDIEIGLEDNNIVEALNTYYSEKGRAYLDSLNLKDVFSTSINKEGLTVGAPSSIEIKKYNPTNSTWGEPVTFASDEDIIVWGTGADPKLVLNSEVLVDSNNDGEADQLTAKYTKYRVTITFAVDEDNWIAEFPNAGYILTQENQAFITSKLKWLNNSLKTDDSESEKLTQEVPLPFDGPASLTILKKFKLYNGNEDWYNGKYQDIYYTLSSAENFIIYSLNPDTNKYEITHSGSNSYSGLELNTIYALNGGISYTVTENLTDYQRTVMVQTDNPAYFTHTPAEGEDWKVTFHNQETIGSLTITKFDDAGHKMNSSNTYPGGDCIGFSLYQEVTDEQGNTTLVQIGNQEFVGATSVAKFSNLPYGTYLLCESKVPPGFAPDYQSIPANSDGYSDQVYDGESYTIREIDGQKYYEIVIDENKEYKLPFTNTINESRIKLTKYVGLAEENITNKADTSYPATFTLQRTSTTTTVDGNEVPTGFADVTFTDEEGNTFSTWKTDAFGEIQIDLPAFDEANGKPYYYRFVETIPDGYYDPENPDATTSTSDYVTLTEVLEDGSVHALPLFRPGEIEMVNRKKVDVQVYKRFYSVNSNGTLSETNELTTEVNLYSYYGNYEGWTQVAVSSADNIIGQNTVDGEGNPVYDYATWEDLPVYGPHGKIHYLVQETDIASFELQGTVIENIPNHPGKYVEISLTTAATSAIFGANETISVVSHELNNAQNLYPVQIWKMNYYSEESVEGAKVTVKTTNDQNETVVASGYIASSTGLVSTTLQDIDIPNQAGEGEALECYVVIYLEPGKVYTFEESENSNTPGLKWYSYDPASQQIDLQNPTAQTVDNKDTEKNKTCYIYNAPDPVIRINKKDSKTGTAISDTEFAIFTFNETTQKYDPYPSAADQIIISTTNANSTVRLEEGKKYYFAEITTPSGNSYINPNVYANYVAYYQPLGEQYKWGDVSVTSNLYPSAMTFYEAEVHGAKVNKENVFAFDFKNVKNAGNLKVLKTVNGVAANDFKITVTSEDGTITKNLVTGNDGNNETGYVTFTNLPVFDEDGELIKYTVSETLEGSQITNYFQASPDQIATLVVGATTRVDENGATLVIENQKRLSWSATKVFRKAFEYDVTHFETPVEGAVIGLFVQGEGENADWTLVSTTALVGDPAENPKLTDENGSIAFSGLLRGKNYVMVEMSSGVGNEHMFPYPFNLTYPPANTTVIHNADLSNYNTVFLYGTTTSKTENLSVVSFPVQPQEDVLINSNHWVQFHVTKWLDNRKDENDKPIIARPSDLVYEHDYDENGSRGELVSPSPSDMTKVDNVVFRLYRHVMGENETSVDFPGTGTYPGAGWQMVGEPYTTGTLYENNIRQEGEFITDSDQNINDHYVYMLVEESVGPNSIKMNPYFTYTFFHEKDTNYTVNLTIDDDEVEYTARSEIYFIDKVNSTDVLDYTPSGPGEDVIYLASVRIAKYQDSFDDKTGERNKDYQPLPGAVFQLKLMNGTLLDTLTVGLDSHYSTAEKTLALAQSSTFQLRPGEVVVDEVTYQYTLVDFANERNYYLKEDEVEANFEFAVVDGVSITGYRIPIQLFETGVPDGYMTTTPVLDLYLCFANVKKPNALGNRVGESWVFNDSYFVLTYGKEGINDANNTNAGEKLAENQKVTSWFITNASSTDYSIYVGDTVNPSKLRIVNYPTTNTSVRLVKYGYKPTSNTVGKTSAQLDEIDPTSIDRIALQNVQMVIKYEVTPNSDNWAFWNYKTDSGKNVTQAEATFTTDENGSFVFPRGLPEGRYMIYETSIGTGINGNYEMTYPSSRPRIFEVTKASVSLSFYNPKKPDLVLYKTDMDGNPVKGLQFKISFGTNQALTGNTDANGKTTFGSLGKNTYILSETLAGYSSAYLAEYLQSNVTGFGTFATTGTLIGYDYAKVIDGNNVDYKMSAVHPSKDLLTEPGTFTITVPNPTTTDLKLTKLDYDDHEKKLEGATFTVYYQPFSQAYTVPPENPTHPENPVELGTIQIPQTQAAFEASGSGWQSIGEFLTDEDGVLELKGKDPGIYAFIETDAPDGYDIITQANGNPVVYTVVVKGGLHVNVSVSPTSATIKKYTTTGETEGTVQTDFTDEVEIVAYNRRQITLNALKVINTGEFDLNNIGEWSITLNLYEYDTETGAHSTLAGTVTIDQDTPQGDPVTFKASSTSTEDALFSYGKTYYFEEVNFTPSDHFVLSEVLKNGVTVDSVNNMYLFPLQTLNGFTITAVNDWLFGEVTFIKVDTSSPPKMLTGASFEVRYDKNADDPEKEEEWVKVPNSTVTEIVDANHAGTGKYYAYIPLVSPLKTTYRIYETSRPTGVAGNPDSTGNYIFFPDTYYKEVTLWLDDPSETEPNNIITDLEGVSIPNSEGDKLTIKKFDNIKDASNIFVDVEKQTQFSVYHYVKKVLVDGTWVNLPEADWYWELQQGFAGYTDETASFTVVTVPGETYAVAETVFDELKYNSPYGMFMVTGTDENGDDILTELPSHSETIGGKEVVLYDLPLTTLGTDIVVYAYNIRNIMPIIVKEDVGYYQKGANVEDDAVVKAMMDYVIYEITAADLAEGGAFAGIDFTNADHQPSRAQVEAFLAVEGRQPVFGGSTTDYGASYYLHGEFLRGTTGRWDTESSTQYTAVENRWDYSKRYLVVETNVSSKDGQDLYSTLRKDDTDVVWYWLTDPVANPNPDDPPVWILKNVYGDATTTITKDTIPNTVVGYTNNNNVTREEDKDWVDSLLKGSREVIYKLTPEVQSRNQMLASFAVVDSGITAYSGNTVVGEFNYQFTKIVVGKASHYVDPKYGEGAIIEPTWVINATITFYDKPYDDPSKQKLCEVFVPDVSSQYSDDEWRTYPSEEWPSHVLPDEAKNAKSFEISYSCADLAYASGRVLDNEWLVTKKDEEGHDVTTEEEFEYALGENFTVEPTTVYVKIMKQDDGTIDDPVYEISQFTNHSKTVLTYPKWKSNGTAIEKVTITAADPSTVYVRPIEIPRVSIQKKRNNEAIVFYNPNTATFSYTITVKNEDGKLDFKNPVVLDILPTGATYVAYSAVAAVSGQTETVSMDDPIIKEGVPTIAPQTNDEGLEISEPEHAIIFNLNGILKPGASVSITYEVQVTKSVYMVADMYAGQKVLWNDAYLSSAEKTFHTQTNPYARSFTDEASQYGKPLVGNGSAASALGESATRREGGVDSELKEGPDYTNFDDYAWIGAHIDISVNEVTSVTLRKAVWGDRDGGFHETNLGYATRTNSRFPNQEGWVKWRLSIVNGYSETETIDGMIIGDVIPMPEDGRNSRWVNVWEKILLVENNVIGEAGTEVDAGDYSLYYYTGDVADAKDAIIEALTNKTCAGNDDFVLDSNYDEERDGRITGFVVIFADSIKLDKNKSLVLIYRTKVIDIPVDSDFTPLAFTNDTNVFYLMYNQKPTTVTVDRVISNPVSVTLMDRPVEIQGDVWIDEDQDGVQETTNRRDYSQYAIINMLSSAISFSIKDMRTGSGATDTHDSGDQKPEWSWNGIGESIKHFRFGEYDDPVLDENGNPVLNEEGDAVTTKKGALGAATTTTPGANPYMLNANGNYELDPEMLKGDDPYYYVLYSTLKDETENGDLTKIFKLSELGSGYYMSDDPDASGFTTTRPGNYFDNNFYVPGTRAQTSTLQSSPFYIRYSNEVDHSKDLGYMEFRGLIITKVAQDNPNTKLQGAKFSVFGPYGDTTPAKDYTPAAAHDATSGTALKFYLDNNGVYNLVVEKDGEYYLAYEGTKVTATEDNPITDELVTDQSGKITIWGLNWWKEYDIKEIAAAQGYEITGTTYTAGTAQTVIEKRSDDVFTLKVPATTKTTPFDDVTVSNPRYVDVQLNVEKVLETYSEQPFTFTFELRLIGATPQTVADLNANNMTTFKLDEDGNPELDENNNPIILVDKLLGTLNIVDVKGSQTTGEGFKLGSFDPVKLNGAGTYKFLITEKKPVALYHGDYDNDLYREVTVKVEWSATENKLVVTDIQYEKPVTVDGTDYEQFTNSYENSGTWKPVIPKQLKGHDGESDVDRPIIPGEFTFTVKEGTKTVSTGSVNADGSITFTDIMYTLQTLGWHTYTITEDTPTLDPGYTGITPSTATITARVHIEDVNGEIKATEVTYSPVAEFINTYEAVGKWRPTLEKILDTVDQLVEEHPFPTGVTKTFTFTVTDTTGGSNEVVLTISVVVDRTGHVFSVSYGENQWVTYDEFDATLEGKVHTYTIAEAGAGTTSGGVTNSTQTFTVNVTVKIVKDETKNTYKKELEVTDNAPQMGFRFINTYQTYGETDLEVLKYLISGTTDETMTALTLNEQFTFVLLDDEGKQIGDPLTTSIDPADNTLGKAVFTAATYGDLAKSILKYSLKDHGKDFVYYIKEIVDPDRDDIIYDTHVLKVTVTPTDLGTGQMNIAKAYATVELETNEDGSYAKDANGKLIETSSIAETTSEARTFKNQKLFSLKVEKIIPDNTILSKFDFTIILKKKDGTPYTGVVPKEMPDGMTWTEKEDEDGNLTGEYSFKLGNGEAIKMWLPLDVKYLITEDASGFIAKVTLYDHDGGEIVFTTPGFTEYTNGVDGVIYIQNPENNKGNQTATFTNTPGNALPLVGGKGTRPFTVAGAIGIGIGVTGLLLNRKKKKDEDGSEEPEKA